MSVTYQCFSIWFFCKILFRCNLYQSFVNMSTNNLSSVLKSCSESELINEVSDNNMTQKQVEGSRLKRTFTLPRNPFGTVKPSSSKNKCSDDIKPISANSIIGEPPKDENGIERKLFRRPSWKRFLNKIAQHMSTVHVSGVSLKQWFNFKWLVSVSMNTNSYDIMRIERLHAHYM